MKFRNYRAFTLIELLVVIAIIGILSTIVIGSVNTARTKGQNAAIKANLNNLKVSAEIYYDTNSSYATADDLGCTASGTSTSFVTTGAGAAGIAKLTDLGTTTCKISKTKWAVSTLLKDSAAHWCVDSTGASKEIAAAITNANC